VLPGGVRADGPALPPARTPMIVVVMGVAGSGKTTVGRLLAGALGSDYLEGDSLHSPESVAKMARGEPLADGDREPWIAALRARVLEAFRGGRDLVVGCSALRRSHRAVLGRGIPVAWVHLKGAPELVRERLRAREGHFMRAEMLDGQLAALEEPETAIVADPALPAERIVERVLGELGRMPEVRVARDGDELGLRAAEDVAGAIAAAVGARGRCSLVLSGGSTPRGLHRALATRFRERVPWAAVHVFWTDERYVPPEDERSNQRMARETLLDHVPVPADGIHPMPTHPADPEEAARAYEATLDEHFGGGWPAFDVVVLGLGADGHTASLFPGARSLREETRRVLAVTGPADPPDRLTLTLPVLTRSAASFFLVEGAAKAPEVGRVLAGDADPAVHPAAAIQRAPGRVVWWVDRALADRLG
jgi:6-phosphogluconolactonase